MNEFNILLEFLKIIDTFLQKLLLNLLLGSLPNENDIVC
jgi:hypothetical protein